MLTRGYLMMKKRLLRYFALAMPALLAACAGMQRPATGPATTSVKPTLAPARAVQVAADCSWTDENGYTGKVKLTVAEAVVQDFYARMKHPRHGSCQFNLADFHQTKKMPNIELLGNNSKCTVRMWSQGRQVSVAFSACAAMCTGDAIDYLWPVLLDAPTGTCG